MKRGTRGGVEVVGDDTRLEEHYLADRQHRHACIGVVREVVVFAVLPTLSLVALLVLAPAGQARIDEAGLTFEIPSGWVDFSPGAPARQQLSAEQLPAITNDAKVLAFDLEGATPEFAPNLNVRLVRCAAISVDFAQKIAAGLKKEFRGMADVKLIDQGIITVDGVRTARLEYTFVATGQTPIRQLQYWLPAGTQCAVATYSASPDQWALYRPIFEESAQATRGLRAPSLGLDTGRILDAAWKGGVKWGLIGGGLGLLFGVGGWWRRRQMRQMITESERD